MQKGIFKKVMEMYIQNEEQMNKRKMRSLGEKNWPKNAIDKAKKLSHTKMRREHEMNHLRKLKDH
jgi:hypothetical protein